MCVRHFSKTAVILNVHQVKVVLNCIIGYVNSFQHH